MNCYLNYDKTAVEIYQTWRISSHFRLEPNAGLFLKYIITRFDTSSKHIIYTMGFVNTCYMYVVNEVLQFYEHRYDPKMSIYYKKKLCQNFSWYIFSIVENQVIFLPCDTIPMFMRNSCFYLFVWIFRPNREFFTLMGAFPLHVKGFKFWLILGTDSQWAVRVL